jgi:hypothetical protein
VIYIAFSSVTRPCDLEINVAFEKSEKEKIKEKRLKLENFKTSDANGGLKAKLDLLSPESR